ncbi:hypothetical protein ACQKG7_08395 [Lysinibacillus fusiformis]|uniref:hypothetical protein n=1 Tax=Lysinibacillus fusiformis TaxID=28031 RepID=UPI0037CA6A1E
MSKTTLFNEEEEKPMVMKLFLLLCTERIYWRCKYLVVCVSGEVEISSEELVASCKKYTKGAWL